MKGFWTRTDRGVALVSVLWIVSALALIAGSAISTATLSRRMGENSLNETRVNYALEAAIYRGLIGLLDPRPAARFRVDGVPQVIRFEKLQIRVIVQDTAGLIDLNDSGSDILERLFQSTGLDKDQAAGLSAQVIKRRTETALFRTIDELKLVPGITPGLYTKLAAALTVHSHQPFFDPAIAPKDVLLTLPSLTADDVDRVMASRAGMVPGVQPVAGKAFAVDASTTTNTQSFEKRAVILITGNSRNPFAVLAWGQTSLSPF